MYQSIDWSSKTVFENVASIWFFIISHYALVAFFSKRIRPMMYGYAQRETVKCHSSEMWLSNDTFFCLLLRRFLFFGILKQFREKTEWKIRIGFKFDNIGFWSAIETESKFWWKRIFLLFLCSHALFFSPDWCPHHELMINETSQPDSKVSLALCAELLVESFSY